NSLHGKDISAISTLPDESEVLFAAQTPFHVQDMQSLDGHLHILLQELP
ncbi:MAG: hypothetical protein JOZ75_02500, partial [Candidatus Dormibacteraeota bacterium]|nr:hypothetical protein [Candidatus Dormibacteraeota bacterium]